MYSCRSKLVALLSCLALPLAGCDWRTPDEQLAGCSQDIAGSGKIDICTPLGEEPLVVHYLLARDVAPLATLSPGQGPALYAWQAGASVHAVCTDAESNQLGILYSMQPLGKASFFTLRGGKTVAFVPGDVVRGGLPVMQEGMTILGERFDGQADCHDPRIIIGSDVHKIRRPEDFGPVSPTPTR